MLHEQSDALSARVNAQPEIDLMSLRYVQYRVKFTLVCGDYWCSTDIR